ncbi:hypothetical protein BC829DRAFT_16696 [Chytridium lagenaria]|nr:hypothetical protein BC829DRAFT_16696 [Chytridium lagenaria]
MRKGSSLQEDVKIFAAGQQTKENKNVFVNTFFLSTTITPSLFSFCPSLDSFIPTFLHCSRRNHRPFFFAADIYSDLYSKASTCSEGNPVVKNIDAGDTVTRYLRNLMTLRKSTERAVWLAYMLYAIFLSVAFLPVPSVLTSISRISFPKVKIWIFTSPLVTTVSPHDIILLDAFLRSTV